jgi:hypothetical protein
VPAWKGASAPGLVGYCSPRSCPNNWPFKCIAPPGHKLCRTGCNAPLVAFPSAMRSIVPNRLQCAPRYLAKCNAPHCAKPAAMRPHRGDFVSPTAMRPTFVLATGSDSVNGVGPTPVLQMHRPKGTTVLSVRVRLPSSTHFTTPCNKGACKATLLF